jgi:hypothetical protein
MSGAEPSKTKAELGHMNNASLEWLKPLGHEAEERTATSTIFCLRQRPDLATWLSFCEQLQDSMPPSTKYVAPVM